MHFIGIGLLIGVGLMLAPIVAWAVLASLRYVLAILGVAVVLAAVFGCLVAAGVGLGPNPLGVYLLYLAGLSAGLVAAMAEGF